MMVMVTEKMKGEEERILHLINCPLLMGKKKREKRKREKRKRKTILVK